MAHYSYPVDRHVLKDSNMDDGNENLQLLHRHCHDEKTFNDLVEIRKINGVAE
ncbi:MAG: HNH endonuclease [Nostoc sp.]|uniref:HNH endonuclease n=1 Tax=Nostoc sp. TaxID=1180 RepID=UPI002FFA8154